MTNREQLQQVFPDVFDKICKYTLLDFLNSEPPAHCNASDILMSAFIWTDTEEGFDFWDNIHDGMRYE